MTDDTGMLQHATFSIPRYDDGYCLDDNARALLLMTLLEEAGTDDPAVVRALASRYLAFVSHAFDRTSGRFRNFLSYGAAVARGARVRGQPRPGAVGARRRRRPRRRSRPAQPRRRAVPCRAAGGHGVHQPARVGVRAARHRRVPARVPGRQHRRRRCAPISRTRLLGLFQRTSNAGLAVVRGLRDVLQRAPVAGAHRLWRAHAARPRWSMPACARSNGWCRCSRPADGDFAPIGSNGFFRAGRARGGVRSAAGRGLRDRARPASTRYRVSGDARWVEHGRRAFDWFLGQNQLQQWLYDASTGGCRDGLHADRVNQNQGAESTLSFLLALVEMRADSRGGRPCTRRLHRCRCTAS